MDPDPGRLPSIGSQSQARLSNFTFHRLYMENVLGAKWAIVKETYACLALRMLGPHSILYKWEESYVLLFTAFQLSASTGKNHSCILHWDTCCFPYYADIEWKIHISLLFLETAFTSHYSPPNILSPILQKRRTNKRIHSGIEELFFLKNQNFFPVVVCRSKTLQIEVPIVFH